MNQMNIRTMALALGMAGWIAGTAQAQFSPRKLAVLRAGDNGASAASDILNAHQAPAFIDEYDPVTNITIPGADMGTNGPVFSVAIPTNDPAIVPPYAALWFNGHAGTEGYLALSGDASTLAFSGYGGDILAVSGTPSGLSIPRGICVIDAFGNTYIPYEGNAWYGLGAGTQTNPRGAVSDNGTNNFFGSGSLDGNEWYQLGNASTPESIQNLSSVRAVKIINGFFYTSLQGNDGGSQYPPGIYDYSPVSLSGALLPPVALPEGDIYFLNLVVPASPLYPNVESFDLNPQKNIAYIADSTYGIQKYVEVAGNWTLACAFGITNNTSGSVTSFPASYTGCFGLVVDWSGSYPVVFATTTEGTGGYTHANRLIRIDDNYNFTDGNLHTNDVTATTLATGWSANIVFRGLAWTPDRRPVITSNPASQSAVAGARVTFTVGATRNFPTGYMWLVNGALDPSQTASNYTVPSATAGGAYQVIVTNQFGAVTSAVATLTVTLGSTAPSLVSPAPALNLTNAIYDTITLPVSASGTTPLNYTWWHGAGLSTAPLNDSGDFTGAATSALVINVSSSADAGSYYVVVNNGIGLPSSNLVATVSVVAPLPVLFVEPVNTTVASNGACSFTALAYPLNATYQWYQGTTRLSDISGHWSGSATSTLEDLNASAADQGSYSVVVTSAGGSVTSSVVTLTVATPAPFSTAPYTSLGMVYRQNFDSLPDPGVTSVNNGTTTKPVLIGGTNYSVGNPFDFAAPAISGGGLNLPSMAGWFSSDTGADQIQATSGDNTTGLIVSFGCTNAVNTVNPLYPTNNRALGIISSPATSAGGNAGNVSDAVFALRLLNQSGQTLTNMNLSYVSELWRNTLTPNAVSNYYYVDPLGTNNTPTNNLTGFLTTLQYPTNLGSAPVSQQKTYGTNAPLATNQISFVNVPLAAPWPQGGVLWLVWEEPLAVSGGQGIGIDNLVFSSGPPTLGITRTNVSGVPSVTLFWPDMFTGYTLQSTTQVYNPNSWATASGGTLVDFQGINSYTIAINPGADEYFRLYNP
jgi:hypothetical protein